MARIQDFVTQNRLKCLLTEHATAARRRMGLAYRESDRLERGPLDAVHQHQQRALRVLLGKAVQVPFYRDLAERLGRPVTEATLDDLERIPFLTKDVLRREGRRLLLPGAGGVYENFSGGSTGIPVRFWQDETYKIHMGVATRRSNELAGAFPGARVAKLWGAPQDKRQIEGLGGRMKLWLLNQRYYDTFDMGPERMEAYHRDLERFQPDIIQAYASSIHLLARFLKQRGWKASYPRLSIITAAEKLFPHMREEIEEVFPARVFDRYGSREVSAMAAECEHHTGMHVQMPGYILETIDPVSGRSVTGRPGEIVITVLYNYAMPFLRYRIGDMGIVDRTPCACGRVFHRLREVVGRTSDNFLMPDGRVVHGEYFTHLFYGRPGVEQFQFIQHEPARFSLQIVPAPDYQGSTAEHLEREVREMIGPVAELRIELREQIARTASGKYRFTVSHVDPGMLVSGAGRRS